MDQKGFELFQSAVQWILDEKRATENRTKHDPIWHKQQFWATGELTDEEITVDQVGQQYLLSWHLTQMRVVCPSSACLAGNIVVIHGDKMVADQYSVRYGEQYSNGLVSADFCVNDKNQLFTIGTRAQQLIGITSQEASDLFRGGNSRKKVIEMATEIAKGYGFELELV